MTLFIGILEQGFIYGIMALGAYIPTKILDFPDLTVDGSPPGGSCDRGTHQPGRKSVPYIPYCGALRRPGGDVHRSDPRKGQGERSSVRHHHDDRPYTINYRIAGKSNVPMFSMKTAFDNDFINSLPAGLTPVRPTRDPHRVPGM